MPEPVTAELFVEDRAHEDFLLPLISRIACEAQLDVTTRVRSARGGHARVMKEFRLYQDLFDKMIPNAADADLLIVAVDCNGESFAKKRAQIREATSPNLDDRLVLACPEPYIERWYMADPTSFERVIGARPKLETSRPSRLNYKQLLADAIREGGRSATLGGIEFASDLVSAMDFYRAGKSHHSLKAFLDDLRRKLGSLVTET